jgi:hypothetical protein
MLSVRAGERHEVKLPLAISGGEVTIVRNERFVPAKYSG